MLNLHYIRMPEQPEELDLSKNPGSVRDVLKDIVDFLDGNLFAGVCVDCRGHNPVTSFPYNFLDLIPTGFTVFRKELCLQCNLCNINAIVRPSDYKVEKIENNICLSHESSG